MSTALPTNLRHPLPARPLGARPSHARALSNATEGSLRSRRSSASSAMGATPVLVSPNPGMTPLRKLGKLADVVLDQPRIDNLQLVNALRQPLAQALIFALLEDDVAHRGAAVEDVRQWSGEALREVLVLEELLLTHKLGPTALRQQKLQPSRPTVCGLIAAALHLCGREGGRKVVESALSLVEPAMAPDERGRMLLLALASALGELAAGDGGPGTRIAPSLLKRRCGAILRDLRRASPGMSRRLRKSLMQELGRALTRGTAERLQLPLSGQFEHIERTDFDTAACDLAAALPQAPAPLGRGLTGYLGSFWGSGRPETAPPPYSAK